MTADRLMILRQLQEVEWMNIDHRVLDLLNEEQTEKIGSSGRGGTVLGTLGIWRARAETNEQAGHPLIGAAELLRELDKRAHNSRVEQLSFIGLEYTCSLFFEWTSRKFVGYVLAKRRTESEERTRLAGFIAMTGMKHLHRGDSSGSKVRRTA